MICTNCKKENREIARFCKWCGVAISRQVDPLEKIVGRQEVKEQFKQIADTLKHLRQDRQTQNIWLNINAIIIGETGTGKTVIPQILSEYLTYQGIIKKPHLKVIDAVDYGRFVEKWDQNIKEARGGILFFDNVQKLLPDSYAKNVNPLDKLFIEMDKWNNDPIVILAGLPGGFEEFLENNPAVKSRFKYLFRLPPLSIEEIYELTLRTLRERYAINGLSQSAKEKLMRQLKYEAKSKDESFRNAHHARQKAEDLFTAYISHSPVVPGEIQEEDIHGYVPPVKTLEDILSELDDFIGMNEVKQVIREIAWEVQANVRRRSLGLGNEEKQSLHIVLTGNPGTGKTSIARKFGEIFEAIGYLESSHVEEVDRSKMVSQYVGETPKVVDKLCDRAMGGILFIDEAYTLAPQNESGTKDEQGLQALEKLMKRMEDDRGNFVVIAAGYKTEMENLLRANPGMRSRFNRFIHINDYTPEELFEILLVFARKKNYRFSEEAAEIARQAISQMYEKRDKNFANAREVRTLFEKICTRQAERINHLPIQEQTHDILQTIQAEDIPFEKTIKVDYTDCLKGLQSLIGLENVKEEISSIATHINMQVKRGSTLSLQQQGNHYIFTGNPGTGKTTVARIMADVFRSLGVVKEGQLIEADRSSMVAGFAGQTAIKTNQLIDKALGGVLFIDEAYTICSGENDTYGKEALDTLLKRLEDDRGRFICIVAGYTKEMHTFIEANPGLKSRFTKTIHFEDYTPTELQQIFIRLATKNNFKMTAETQSALLHHFEKVYATRTTGFGNARDVRSLFEQSTTNQSKRLIEIMNSPGFTQDMMSELTTDDILAHKQKQAKSLDEIMAELDSFIGMKSIKEAIRRLAVQVVFMQQRLQLGIGSSEPMSLNIVLTGNPGTGKTTIARKMGEMFKAIGLLPTDNVIEVSRNQMVGKYMGETPKLVNSLCDRAMGGILFIDEAYTLYDADGGNGDKFGKEAVEALMKRMEDDKGKFVVIAAGYRKEMETFLKINPGLESRFTHRLNIEDYTEMELVEIFKSLARKKQYVLPETTEAVLIDTIHHLCMNKNRSFGNAREIRSLFDNTISQLSMRVSAIPPSLLSERDYQVIEPADIPAPMPNQFSPHP